VIKRQVLKEAYRIPGFCLNPAKNKFYAAFCYQNLTHQISEFEIHAK